MTSPLQKLAHENEVKLFFFIKLWQNLAHIYNIVLAKLIKSKVILIQEHKIKDLFGMINHQTKFFKLSGSLHNKGL